MVYPGNLETNLIEHEQTKNYKAAVKDVCLALEDNGYKASADIFLRMMLQVINGKETER